MYHGINLAFAWACGVKHRVSQPATISQPGDAVFDNFKRILNTCQTFLLHV